MSCQVACVIQGCFGKDVVVGMCSLMAVVAAVCRCCQCACGWGTRGSCGGGCEYSVAVAVCVRVSICCLTWRL